MKDVMKAYNYLINAVDEINLIFSVEVSISNHECLKTKEI